MTTAKVLATAACLLRAKLRRRPILVAELVVPSLIMLITFVLGWSISTIDRFQMSVHADETHSMLRTQGALLRNYAQWDGIADCLQPLAKEMDAQLAKRAAEEDEERLRQWKRAERQKRAAERAAEKRAGERGAAAERERGLGQTGSDTAGGLEAQQSGSSWVGPGLGGGAAAAVPGASAGRSLSQGVQGQELGEQVGEMQGQELRPTSGPDPHHGEGEEGEGDHLSLDSLADGDPTVPSGLGSTVPGRALQGLLDQAGLSWASFRRRPDFNSSVTPSVAAGRHLAMALLEAVRAPAAAAGLDTCEWGKVGFRLMGPTLWNLWSNLMGPAPLFTFDEYVLSTALLNASTSALGSENSLKHVLHMLMPTTPLDCMRPGYLALVPDTEQVRAFAAHMSDTTHYFDDVFLGVFNSSDDALEAAAAATGPAPSAGIAWGGSAATGRRRWRRRAAAQRPLPPPSRLWAVVEFASGPEPGTADAAGAAEFAIRMDALNLPRTFNRWSPVECKTCEADYLPYAASGFLSLQASVNAYLLGPDPAGGPHGPSQGPPDDEHSEAHAWLPGHPRAHRANSSSPGAATDAGHTAEAGAAGAGAEAAHAGPFGVWYVAFPAVGQEVNSFYEYGAPMLGLVTTASFALPVAMSVRSMVSQRQAGLQHLLAVLGLPEPAWQLAWAGAVLPVMAGSWGLEWALAQASYLHLVQPSLLAAVMGAGAAACGAWVVLLGSAFGDARVASTGSFMASLLAGLPFVAFVGAPLTQMLPLRRVLCLLWPVALSNALHRMASGHQTKRFGVESEVPGLRWATAGDGPLPLTELLGLLLADAALYLALAAALAAWRGRSGGRRLGGGKGAAEEGGEGKDAGRPLRLWRLRHRYPGAAAEALRGVSISVSAGEGVALLGRNAAGKSTLVALASGRLAPSGGGGVAIGGQDVQGPGGGGAAFRQLGFCPQGNVLLEDLTVREHLELALVLRGAAGAGGLGGCLRALFGVSGASPGLGAAAERLADLVSLPADMMGSRAGALSGGSKRKLQLGLAMAGEPQVLLLDEVTAGVDAESRQAIWRALVRAKRGLWGSGRSAPGSSDLEGQGAAAPWEAGSLLPKGEGAGPGSGPGASLLFTSHHLGEVAALADTVVVLAQGQVQSETPASALHAALQGGQCVLTVTSRPVSAPDALASPAASDVGLGSSLASVPGPSAPLLTRAQLTALLVSRLPYGTARVLYSGVTSTAVAVDMHGGGKGADPAAALSRLKRQLRALAMAGPFRFTDTGLPQASGLGGGNSGSRLEVGAQNADEGKEDAQLVAEVVEFLDGGEGGGLELSPLQPRGPGEAIDGAQEAQPLGLVRCSVGPPSLEDILLLSAAPSGLAAASPEEGAAWARPSPPPPPSAPLAPPGPPPPPTATSSSSPYPTASPTSSSPSDFASALDPLLRKHAVQWLRDWRTSLRLLLLPVLAVGLCVLAMQAKPPNAGPPAPLDLAWLGLDGPVPATGLPLAWQRQAAAAFAAASTSAAASATPAAAVQAGAGEEARAALLRWATAASRAGHTPAADGVRAAAAGGAAGGGPAQGPGPGGAQDAAAEGARARALHALGLVPLPRWALREAAPRSVSTSALTPQGTLATSGSSLDVSYWVIHAARKGRGAGHAAAAVPATAVPAATMNGSLQAAAEPQGPAVEESSSRRRVAGPASAAEEHGASGWGGPVGRVPYPPLQGAVVFGDAMVGPGLRDTAWASLGWALLQVLAPPAQPSRDDTRGHGRAPEVDAKWEAALAAAGHERGGEDGSGGWWGGGRKKPGEAPPELSTLRSYLQAVATEVGALPKFLDYLYDRMLLNEFLALVGYATRRKGAAPPPPPPLNASAPAFASGLLDHDPASAGLAAFRLSAVMRVCNLSVAEPEGQGRGGGGMAGGRGGAKGGGTGVRPAAAGIGGVDEAAEEEGAEDLSRGGRALLMRYRPPLNVSLYLLAGLLPPHPAHCPLARLLVEHAGDVAQVLSRHVTRRRLPGVTLMWNVSTPHGPPALLSHLANTLLRLKAGQRHAHTQGQHQPAHQHSATHQHGLGSAGAGTRRPLEETPGAPADHAPGDSAAAAERRLGDTTPQPHAGVPDAPEDPAASGSYRDAVYGAGSPSRARSHPLPPRGASAAFVSLLDHLLLAVLCAMPLCYTTGSFVVRSAQERASGAKQQQLAAGRCSAAAYWLSTWLSDLFACLGPALALVGLLWAGGAASFAGDPLRCLGCLALLVAHAAAALPWGYCIAARCDTPAAAQGLVSNAGLLAGVGLGLARQVLAHVHSYSAACNALMPLLRLLPPFCLVDALLQLSLLDVVVGLAGVLDSQAARHGALTSALAGHLVGIDPSNPSPFQPAVLGLNLAYLGLDAVLYGSVLLFMEWRAARYGDDVDDDVPYYVRLPNGLLGGRGLVGWLRGAAASLKAAAAAARGLMRPSRYSALTSEEEAAGLADSSESHLLETGEAGGAAMRRRGAAKEGPLALVQAQAGWRKEAGSGGDDEEAKGDSDLALARLGLGLGPGDSPSEGAAPEPPADCLVRMCNVFKAYPNGTVALRGLSLGLREGECLALVGRNAAGKSTAMGVLSGRLRPSSGRVTVGGVDVGGRPQAARSRVAVCPQTNPLLPLLTPAEHLTLYAALHDRLDPSSSSASSPSASSSLLSSPCARLHLPIASSLLSPARLPPAAAARLSDVASRCGLPPDLLHRPACQLSGGSQRKLSLALALLGRPQLLLLDEPSAGMDPPARRAFCDAINMALRGGLGGGVHAGAEAWAGASGGGAGLVGGGSEGPVFRPAVVLTTHYGEEALALCDCVGVLEGGRLLACGPPGRALRAPELRGHYLGEAGEWGGVLPGEEDG